MAGSSNGVHFALGFKVQATPSANYPFMQQNATDASIYNNAGTPEGVISANLGSICMDRSNGNLYYKHTGTGTTGWLQIANTIGSLIMVTGNTGTASPSAGNLNLLGSGSLTTSASGSTVTYSLTGLTNHSVLVGAGTSTITKVGPTATAGQVLQSAGSSADPAFSTATYPSTTTINQILYSSSANTVGGITAANSAILLSSSTGVPSWSATLTNGQLLIGNTGNAPTPGSITSGDSSITITPGAGTISLSVTGGTTVGKTITGDSGGALSPTAGNWNILSTTTNGIDTSGSGSTLTIGMATPYADGDFEFRSSVSGATRVLSVTNTSNTASSQSQMTHSVAGTSAGDTWNQYTVGTTRTYAQGIDNSDSQKLKLTTAAGATANPSTATPVWSFTPGTGFNYDDSGTSGFGIGFGQDPDTNYAVKMTKSANATFGIQVQNSNNGNAALAGINFVNNTPVGCSLSVPSSTFSDANVRDALYINGGGSGALGIVYSATTTGFHKFYADSATGNLIATLTNTNMTMSRPFVIGTQQIFSTRQTAPSAGALGEVLSGSNTSGNVLSSATVNNVTSVTLTAGVWDICANAFFASSGTNTLTSSIAAVSTANNNTTPADLFGAGVVGMLYAANGSPSFIGTAGGQISTLTFGPGRLYVTTNTSYFLNVNVTGASVAASAYGVIRAVRIA